MSIDGRITVDAIFHDTSGSRLKVLSLESSTGYGSGVCVRITGTAAANTYELPISWATYRNAAGQLVTLNDPRRIAFSWSGATEASLTDIGDESFTIHSKNNEVAVTGIPVNASVVPSLDNPTGDTATYTVIVWGDS